MKIHASYSQRINLDPYGQYGFFCISVDQHIDTNDMTEFAKTADKLALEAENAVRRAIHRGEAPAIVNDSPSVPAQPEVKTAIDNDTPKAPAAPTPKPEPAKSTPVAVAIKPNGNGNGNGKSATKKVVRPNDGASQAQINFWNKLSTQFAEAMTGLILSDELQLPENFDFTTLKKGSASELLDKAIAAVTKAKEKPAPAATSKPAPSAKSVPAPVPAKDGPVSNGTGTSTVRPANPTPSKPNGKPSPAPISERQRKWILDLVATLKKEIGEPDAIAFVEQTTREVCKGYIVDTDKLLSYQASKIIDALKLEVSRAKNAGLAAASLEEPPF